MTFPGSQRGQGLSSELRMQFMESSGESSRAPTMCRTRAVPTGAAPGPVSVAARDPLIAPRASQGSCCKEATAQGVSATLLHVLPFLPPWAKCSWSTVSVSGVLAKRWPHHACPKPQLLFHPICSCKIHQEAPKGAGLQLRRQCASSSLHPPRPGTQGWKFRARRGGQGWQWGSLAQHHVPCITSHHISTPCISGAAPSIPKKSSGQTPPRTRCPQRCVGAVLPSPPPSRATLPRHQGQIYNQELLQENPASP